MTVPVPVALHREDHALRVTWAEGHVGIYPARELRLACQCAECRDELTGRLLLRPEQVSEAVALVTVSLVGGYGVQVRWDDGHDAGIYTYDALRSWCPCAACAAERPGPESPARTR